MNKLKVGDKITIAGHGVGAKGQLVIDGVNPRTRRKCRAVKPMVYRITAEKVIRAASGG